MWLTLLLFFSPGLKDHPVTKHKNSIAFLMALLFVSHPLATGSVTYKVQLRMNGALSYGDFADRQLSVTEFRR